MAEINGQEVDNKSLANAIIAKYKDNKVLSNMVEAEKYYRVENTNIENKKREYVDGKGSKKENTTVSNVKLPNAFYRKSVKQKVDYAFGKPPIIGIEPINEETSNEEQEKLYQKAWENLLLDPHNRGIIKNLARKAINCGIGFVYTWIKDDKFNIVDVPSESIMPMWKDKSHTELQFLVRNYKNEIFKDEAFEEVPMVELWTEKDVTTFKNDGELEVVTNAEPHMDNKSWDKIPFLFLKGTEDETPLLKVVKRYIDAYDDLNSQSVDGLKDDLDAIVIFKNYTNETGKLIDALKTLKETKAAGVSDDGGVEFLKNNPDITAIQTKLEHLKKDINEFSSTVDIQDIKLGTNPSGVAIKSSYQDLDTYTNDIETEFELFVNNLKYFYDLYLDWSGIVNKSISSQYKVIVTLDRDMMINETEIVDNIIKLKGELSQETLDDNNPYVESHTIEQARREAEAELNATKENAFDFPTTPEEEETETIIE